LLVGVATAATFDCLPSEPCWPSPRKWAQFNSSVDGKLVTTKPWASSCYDVSGHYDPEHCQVVEAAYGDDEARSSIYGATQNIQWETCGQAQCLVRTLNPQSPPIDGECSLGSLSAYHVNATTANDVQKTLIFANDNNIRLSIKNSGHDYMGRSVAANSLALWTRNIRKLEYHSTFTLSGCSQVYTDIGVVGAGQSATETRDFFALHGMDVTLGAVGSVGPAGGFGQGGGHGPLGPKYGLMVDQAVEFDVVTANGEFRTINACQDPDLFWAMKGGGGGTFAVLINYKFKVHPSVPFSTYTFRANLSNPETDLTKSTLYRELLTAFVNNQTEWSNNNISGYNFFTAKGFEIHLVYPSEEPISTLVNLTSEWSAFLDSHPGFTVSDHSSYTRYKTYRDWHTSHEYGDIIKRNAPGGIAVVEVGRLVPRKLFAPENADTLVDALLQGMTEGAALPGFAMQVYATTPANTPDSTAGTSAHPAWRDALWTLDFVSGYIQNTPEPIVARMWSAVRRAMQGVKKLTPGGGCYLNEADFGEEDWQHAFFGGHYDRLLEIKQRYDPHALFNCWKCVGWTG
ncbi:FAD-binding domain-containing protein, partial [Saccharata proteae CBS 121410]